MKIENIFNIQFFRFLLVGFANTVLGFSLIFFFMLVLNLGHVTSNVLSYMIGLLVSYAMHKKYTFKKNKNRVFSFVICFAVSYSINLSVLIVLVDVISFNKIAAQVISCMSYILVFYFMNKWYVFKDIPERNHLNK
jgi:putative flippase GtrA